MHLFNKGDKVCVKGLDMAFVFGWYVNNHIAKIFIEGESMEGMHYLIYARPEVLLPNNEVTLREEGWLKDYES
jgi:hypothetical protein